VHHDEEPFHLTALRARFGEDTVARGYRIVRAGGVRREGWDGEGRFRATVADDEPRRVSVRWHDGELTSRCACGQDRCAHVAAVLLDLGESPQAAPGPAGPRLGERVPWQVALHRTLQEAAPVPDASPGQPRLIYRLVIDEDGEPVVETHKATSGRFIGALGPGKESAFPLTRTWGADPLEPVPGFLLPDDVSLCRQLRQFPAETPRKGQRGAATHRFRPPRDTRFGLLLALAATGRLHLGEGAAPLVRGPGRAAMPTIAEVPDGWSLSLPELSDGVTQVIAAEPPLYCDGRVLGAVLTTLPGPLAALLAGRPLFVPEAERGEFLTHWLPALSAHGEVRLPEGLAARTERDARPTARLVLSDGGGVLDLALEFTYGAAAPVAALGGARPVAQIGEGVVVYRRDPRREQALVDRLATPRTPGLSPPLAKAPAVWSLAGEAAYDFLLFELPLLAEEGWEIYGEASLASHRVHRGRARLTATVASGLDWFDLRLTADFDGGAVSPAELLALWEAGRRYVRLKDGKVARIPDWVAARADALREAGLDKQGEKKDETRLSRFQVPLVLELIEGGHSLVDASFKDAAARLKDFSGIRDVPAPKGLETDLRPYQAEGLKWLEFLREYGFHGILADDMGLGKTVQVIALLLKEKERGHLKGPSLIVVPTSLIFNWAHEIARFAPALSVVTWHGPDRHTLARQLAKADVVLTNYALVRQDVDRLEGMPFHYLVVDEAQYIKNPESQVSRAVRQLSARHRLALTGTPLENHLGELWAHFAFLMPGLLGGYPDFRRRFGGPIERGDAEAAEVLLARVRPFILRRTKEQVESELPERVETVLYCRLEGAQRALYERIRDACRERVARSIQAKGLGGSRVTILDALLKLRQVCCHPALLPDAMTDGLTESAKMDLFLEFVTESMEEGHRLLVFSQFVTMLKLIRERLDESHVPYAYLDGRTRDREAKVKAFQEHPEIPLFLISLKAGGTGLNLTGADYVVHFDPWWNPAVERQATDRAHRIGQTRKVFSYKLIAEDTVEEKILALQERKQALSDVLLGGEPELVRNLSVEDLEKIFGGIGSP
jgi:non-specific serine/threonine protein kinase